MTDNQQKAESELLQYYQAKQTIKHLAEKIAEHETKVNKTTRACDSIMQQTFIDGKFISVPMVIQVSGNNSRENLIDALMDQRHHYMEQQAIAERLCMQLEINIANRCNPKHARFLRSHYLHSNRLEKIAVDESYSYRHARRIKWMALEEYGEKMSSHVHKY